MNTKNLVSVVMPVYNGENYLKDALDSVVHQNYNPIEVILINDGSTDKTLEIAKSYGDRIRVISKDNMGLATALNEGIALCSGEKIAFLDHDDIWESDALQALSEEFLINPSIQIVQGKLSEFTKIKNDSNIVRYNIQLGCCLFKRTIFDRTGPFDTNLKIGMDFDLFAKLDELNIERKFIDKVVLHYRKHKTNSIHNKEQGVKDFLSLLRNKKSRVKNNSN